MTSVESLRWAYCDAEFRWYLDRCARKDSSRLVVMSDICKTGSRAGFSRRTIVHIFQHLDRLGLGKYHPEGTSPRSLPYYAHFCWSESPLNVGKVATGERDTFRDKSGFEETPGGYRDAAKRCGDD